MSTLRYSLPLLRRSAVKQSSRLNSKAFIWATAATAVGIGASVLTKDKFGDNNNSNNNSNYYDNNASYSSSKKNQLSTMSARIVVRDSRLIYGKG